MSRMNVSSSSGMHTQGAFTHVSEHLHIIALSTVFFFAVDILSVPFGRAFFPKQYAGFNKKTQRVWRSRAVGESRFSTSEAVCSAVGRRDG